MLAESRSNGKANPEIDERARDRVLRACKVGEGEGDGEGEADTSTGVSDDADDILTEDPDPEAIRITWL